MDKSGGEIAGSAKPSYDGAGAGAGNDRLSALPDLHQIPRPTRAWRCRLLIAYTFGLVNLAIHSESLLQEEVKNMFGLRQLIIHALTLKELKLVDCFAWTQPVADISAPQLESLHWRDLQHGSATNHAFLRLLERFQAIDTLQISLIYPKHIGNFQYLMDDIMAFPRLEGLAIYLKNEDHAFGATVFNVLRMCTGLVRFALVLDSDIDLEIWTSLRKPAICSPHGARPDKGLVPRTFCARRPCLLASVPKLAEACLIVRDALGLVNLAIHSESLLQVELRHLVELQQLIIDAPALKELKLPNNCFAQNQHTTDVSAPQLVSLELSDPYVPSSIQLGNMELLQRLATIFFLVYGPEGFPINHTILELLTRFRGIQDLTLNLAFPRVSGKKASELNHVHGISVIGHDQYLMEDITIIPRISFLTLVVMNYGHAFGASLFHVLKKCTGLRSLSLHFEVILEEPFACRSGCICDQPINWKTNKLLLGCLQEVEITNMNGADHEVQAQVHAQIQAQAQEMFSYFQAQFAAICHSPFRHGLLVLPFLPRRCLGQRGRMLRLGLWLGCTTWIYRQLIRFSHQYPHPLIHDLCFVDYMCRLWGGPFPSVIPNTLGKGGGAFPSGKAFLPPSAAVRQFSVPECRIYTREKLFRVPDKRHSGKVVFAVNFVSECYIHGDDPKLLCLLR
ncbi:hypothetical protein EJB05_13868, partial [Eragrostis curvula]